MCTHSRFIYNRFSRRHVLVPCGKCPSCLQQKAQARAQKIRNNVSDGNVSLFVTLTYSNDYVPYIKKSELRDESFDINVYRNCDARFTYSRFTGHSFRKTRDISIVDRFAIPMEFRSESEISSLQPLRGLGSDCVGVCLYSDVQNFYKRLRQILKRDYNYDRNFTYFCCTEYGSVSKRPHSHHLIFVRSEDEKVFRAAIVKAWPYADKHRTEEYIELAKDAASYVASYVSGTSSLSSCLQTSFFKQKHNSSQNFGVFLDCFRLRAILSKIDQRDLFYYRSKTFDGDTAVDALPIPKYVLNRFFPWCKGFSRLSTSELFSLLLSPERAGEFLAKIDNPLYSYTPKELYSIYVRLDNAFLRFQLETGLNRFDYARYYINAWIQRSSNVFKMSFIDVDDFSDFYENANDLYHGAVSSPTLLQYLDTLQLNPNKREDIVLSSENYTRLYYMKDKQKKVSNYCLTAIGHNF